MSANTAAQDRSWDEVLAARRAMFLLVGHMRSARAALEWANPEDPMQVAAGFRLALEMINEGLCAVGEGSR